MEKLLEIKNLKVQYNTDEAVVYALNDFSLDLEKGEILGVVGETGAGKTTMALSVMKLLPEHVAQVTGGSIAYNGKDVFQMSKKQLRALRGAEVSMIFQDPMTSLNPVMTVGDQIDEVLKIHNPSMSRQERDEKVAEILTLVGIPPERRVQFPHQFSGGMKQRVVIAMALVAKPNLLLADEPTTALDVTIQAQILTLMKNLQEQFGTSMIFITHDLGIVAEFCENVAVVYGGEVIERGTVEQVFARTANHPYTDSLFRCIPDLTGSVSRLTPIPGFVLDSRTVPAGCPFADRCARCTELCRSKKPSIHYVEDGHYIKCHLYENEVGKCAKH
ncbi:MAG TPA: ABC transporter ATP-binding protein [Candidatus Gemmiger faecigallinarum]|mgnify:FL=1|nr:ABC transporter ATP-binding protein [Candidatus Gemmiger faecigallinarum]